MLIDEAPQNSRRAMWRGRQVPGSDEHAVDAGERLETRFEHFRCMDSIDRADEEHG
jgi:hypothetical protein